MQPPTWDDEPAQVKPSEPVVQEEPKAKEEEPAPTPSTAPVAQPETVERVLSALPPQVQPSIAKPESVQAPAPVKPATPAQHTRPTSAALKHKFKADQAVIMPSGSFASTMEKIGMQFGSLGLGGDDMDLSTYVIQLSPPATHLTPTVDKIHLQSLQFSALPSLLLQNLKHRRNLQPPLHNLKPLPWRLLP